MESASTSSKIFEKWMEIQDFIGKANLWPLRVRRLFWTANLKHFDRIIVCAFVSSNGLNPCVFLEWAYLLNLGRDQSAYRHFEALFKLFENKNYNLYAYNVTNNRYEYLDGSVRHYKHRSLRQ